MGRAFVFGDGIDTDVLAPGAYIKLPAEALARHCLEAVDPAFAGTVQLGDVVVAGRNFGLGSSREQAAISLKVLGLSAVLAVSFSRIFYRNAINAGLLAISLPEARAITAGDEIDVDLYTGEVRNITQGERYFFDRPPPELMAILESGGLIPYLEKHLVRAR